MAISAGTVHLDIAPQLARGFGNDLERQIGRQTGDVGDRVGKSLGSKIGGGITRGLKIAAVALPVAGAAAVAVGKKFFDLGAQLEASAAKANTVFGDQIGVVQKWAKESAAAMGLTRSEAVTAASSFADLLVPMGFAREEAAKMSTEVVGLSGALSEWSGGQKSATEVADILAKAMLGEREGLKSLGISITEADVAGRLAAKGQKELTGAALAQAKAVATQELIFEKSTDAQDAYANGTAKGLRSQAKFTAAIGEAKEALAKALYPTLVRVMTFVANNIEPAMAKVKTTFEAWKPTFQAVGKVIGDVFNTIVGTVKTVVEAISDFVGRFRSGQGEAGETADKLGAIFGQFKEYVESVFGAVQAVVTTVVKIVTNLWDRFGKDILQVAKAAWDGILEVVRGALNILTGIFDLIKSIFTGKWGEAWEAIKKILDGAWDAIWGVIRLAIFGIGDFLLQAGGGVISAAWSTLWNGLKTLFSDLWDGIFGAVKAAWGKVVEFFKGIPSTMGDVAKTMWSWITDGLEAILNAAIALIEKGINLATAPLRGAAGFIDKLTPGELPDFLKDEVALPRVGGDDTAAPAAGQPATGDPLVSRFGSGATNNVTVNVTQTDPDPQHVAREIMWALAL